jgi:23S rRNA (cytosine1962-C5)-methyltransferase
VVRVVDPRGWFLGKAFYSSTSKIALRWMSFEDVEVGRELLAARIAQADALRRALYPGETTYRGQSTARRISSRAWWWIDTATSSPSSS